MTTSQAKHTEHTMQSPATRPRGASQRLSNTAQGRGAALSSSTPLKSRGLEPIHNMLPKRYPQRPFEFELSRHLQHPNNHAVYNHKRKRETRTKPGVPRKRRGDRYPRMGIGGGRAEGRGRRAGGGLVGLGILQVSASGCMTDICVLSARRGPTRRRIGWPRVIRTLHETSNRLLRVSLC